MVKKIILFLIFGVLLVNSPNYAGEYIEGKSWNNPDTTWSGNVGLIPKSDTEKRVAAMATYVVGGVVTASATVDTSGLASSAQITTLTAVIKAVGDTIIAETNKSIDADTRNVKVIDLYSTHAETHVIVASGSDSYTFDFATVFNDITITCDTDVLISTTNKFNPSTGFVLWAKSVLIVKDVRYIYIRNYLNSEGNVWIRGERR